MIDRSLEQGFDLVRLGECLDDPEENWYRDPVTGGPARLKEYTRMMRPKSIDDEES